MSGTYGLRAAQRLKGKTALITGASSGIGRAIAYGLAEAAGNEGMNLILAGRRLDRLNEIKLDLTSKFTNTKILPFKLDMADYHTIPEKFNALPISWRENISILVNNAGVGHGTDLVGECKQEDIDSMMNTNVFGLISLTQILIPQFRKRGLGDIVNLGSIAGIDPSGTTSIYCASKAAIRAFTDSLRKEIIDSRIRVIQVHPGAVETEFSQVRFKDKDRAAAVYQGTDPLVAEDIADVVLFALTRRLNTVIAETTVFSTNQASASHIYRRQL
ncbi:hypothetical protein TRICI_006294 [Trichomonascus ciferrii]|uniref:Uncharacterized protein n=1 Tax=Trichomonascus ciferrii TaxID=44093 RepID=A0A642UIV9_9ASCO|nr:hypothetical protein TRICI_006294 [Trichomonascus ciferrii]